MGVCISSNANCKSIRPINSIYLSKGINAESKGVCLSEKHQSNNISSCTTIKKGGSPTKIHCSSDISFFQFNMFTESKDQLGSELREQKIITTSNGLESKVSNDFKSSPPKDTKALPSLEKNNSSNEQKDNIAQFDRHEKCQQKTEQLFDRDPNLKASNSMVKELDQNMKTNSNTPNDMNGSPSYWLLISPNGIKSKVPALTRSIDSSSIFQRRSGNFISSSSNNGVKHHRLTQSIIYDSPNRKQMVF